MSLFLCTYSALIVFFLFHAGVFWLAVFASVFAHSFVSAVSYSSSLVKQIIHHHLKRRVLDYFYKFQNLHQIDASNLNWPKRRIWFPSYDSKVCIAWRLPRGSLELFLVMLVAACALKYLGGHLIWGGGTIATCRVCNRCFFSLLARNGKRKYTFYLISRCTEQAEEMYSIPSYLLTFIWFNFHI